MICAGFLFSVCGCRPDPDLILKGSDESSAVQETQECSAKEEPSSEAAEDAGDSEDSAALAVVYVCGAVQSPGVYELSADARIVQAVEAAGGMLDTAAADAVNLADTVQDGVMIRIPYEGEDLSEESLSEGGAASDGRVNLNTATETELMTLTGIGETKAKQIISYREEHGAFLAAEELMNVSGIGESTYEKIKDDITVH